MATIGTTQSSIDVASIVSQLMTIERRPLTQLQQKEASYQARLTAYGTLKGALSSFQGALSALNSPSAYQGVKASSSDEAQVKVSASSSAAPGSHSVRVTALASSHVVASNRFTATTDTVGSGTITFQKGTFSTGTFTPNADAPTKSVTIAANQNTLTGIRDAVNAANIGVTASIVNDGTGNRLVFASTSGGENSLKITVDDDDTTDTNTTGLSQLAYDPAAAVGAGKNLEQVQAAQDATAIIDGITVTSSTNVVNSAIEGVTFTLNATSSTAATVKIDRDTAGIKTKVEAFVKAYNDLNGQLKELGGYNAETKQAGPLQGDSTIRLIQNDLRRLLTTPLTSTGKLQSLKDIGVALDRNGVLQLDSAKLQTQLDADPGAIAALFAKAGKASDSRVTFLKAGTATKAGTYAVDITQAATKGSLVGAQAAALTITAGVNDSLSVTVNGTAATVTLAAATYASADALAAEVQSRINGATTLSSNSLGVTVTNNAGTLTIASNTYGASSSVAVSGNAATDLLGAAPTATAGLDVQGTIDGGDATGTGQKLVSTNGNSIGMELQIVATAPGSLGTVTYFEGVSAKLDARISELLNESGPVRARTDGINTSIRNIERRAQVLTDRLGQIEQRYIRQYSALDTMLAQMSSTSAYLQQQLAQLSANIAG